MTGSIPEISRIAETHRATGDFAGPVRMMERAAGLDPMNPEIHARLGICLNRLNRFAALKPLRRALKLDPTDLVANRELGVILTSLGDHAGAATCFDAVVRARPGDTMALTMFGKARCRLGQREDGIACLHRAMTLSGDSFEPHYQLSMLKRFEPDHPDMARLQDRFAKTKGKAPPDQEANLALALANAKEDCGNFDAVAGLYLHGKQLLRRATPNSLDAARRLVDWVNAVFDRETIAAVCDRGLSGLLPVFVVDLPRSGKTSLTIHRPAPAHGANERPDRATDYERLFTIFSSVSVKACCSLNAREPLQPPRCFTNGTGWDDEIAPWARRLAKSSSALSGHSWRGAQYTGLLTLSNARR